MANMAMSMAAPNSSMKTREKAVFIAQQLHFANTLAGNDPVHRARAMKKLRKYLFARANGNFCFSHDDFMRIWKGLFYCMWMSDKPLIQEELAEEISQLVHCFQRATMELKFVKAFFDTLIIEWFGIDFHRMDKFQMFVRRFLRQCLVYCKNKKWKRIAVNGFCDVIESTILSPSKCVNECGDLSLIMHFADIFVEELAKIGGGMLPKEKLLEFLKPFISNVAEQEDFRLLRVIRDRVFFCLIKQTPEGMEYEEKFEAWRQAGFPGKSWKEMVFIGKEDKRSGIKIKDLDPRAGKVNVYLPHLELDAGSVAETLRKYAAKSSKSKCQKFILRIAHKFQELACGRYPLTMNISRTLLDSNKYKFSKQKIDDAVEDLINFEEGTVKEYKPFKRKGKSDAQEKNKKRKLKKQAKEESNENLESESNDGSSSEILSSEEFNFELEGSDSSLEQNKVLNVENASEDKRPVKRGKNVESKEYKENGVCTNVSAVHNSKTPKKRKKQKALAWSISEMSSFQEESSEAQNITEESENMNLPEKRLNGMPDSWSEHAVSCELLQDKSQKEIVIDETVQEECKRSNKEVMRDMPDMETQVSLLVIEDNVPQEVDVLEDNIACREQDTVAEDTKIQIPLRRSTRRRSSVVVEENVKEKEINSPTQYISIPLRASTRIRLSKEPENNLFEEMEKIADVPYNDGTAESVKKTAQRTSKRRLSEDEESPMLKRQSIIRAKGRISTVPDREIPGVQESSVIPKSEDIIMNSLYDNSENSPINEVLNNNQMLDALEDSLSTSWSLQNTFRTPIKQTPKKRVSLRTTPSSTKKVNIVLQMNKSQAVSEYKAAVKQSPSVPHDANKMPSKGVLKRTSLKSPINPFYIPPKGLK